MDESAKTGAWDVKVFFLPRSCFVVPDLVQQAESVFRPIADDFIMLDSI
jgi:hypothetical protein